MTNGGRKRSNKGRVVAHRLRWVMRLENGGQVVTLGLWGERGKATATKLPTTESHTTAVMAAFLFSQYGRLDQQRKLNEK